jgi:hypothetical protein
MNFCPSGCTRVEPSPIKSVRTPKLERLQRASRHQPVAQEPLLVVSRRF